MAKHPLPLIIEDTYVRQDDQGRFSLNDLHQAAGGEDRHRPSRWAENQQTKDLIAEINGETRAGIPARQAGIPALKAGITALKAGIPALVSAQGGGQGTYAVRELVYAYAMWISPAFHLKVIRTFDALATGRTSLPNTSGSIGQSTGMVTTQLIALQTHAWKLVDRLKEETVSELRQDLYQQIEKVYADMGMPPPPLAAIGWEAPEMAADVAMFFGVVQTLDRLGHPVNHSRNPELIAVKLPQVISFATKEGLDVPPLGTVFKRQLRASKAPRFLECKSVSSALTGLTEHCWVFAVQKGGAA